MSNYNNLTEKQQSTIQNKLLANVDTEHSNAYSANIAKAKNKRQKDQCAGKYVGSWFRLMNDWIQGKVTNLHIYDCLGHGHVIGDTTGVIFSPAPTFRN